MWSCRDCNKTYAHLHKLQHHQTWSCPVRGGTSGVCEEARRPLSSILLSNQPAEKKKDDETGKEKEDEKDKEGEGEASDVEASKAGAQ